MRRAVLLVGALAVVLAPEVARADDAHPQVDEHDRERRARFGARAEVGGSLSQLFGVGIHAFEGSLALGADLTPSVGAYIAIRGERGQTRYGLASVDWSGDFTLEGIVGRVRLGGGPGLHVISITRASDGTPIDGTGFGLHASISVDLWRDEGGRALYVATRPEAISWSGVTSWSAAATLGFRL